MLPRRLVAADYLRILVGSRSLLILIGLVSVFVLGHRVVAESIRRSRPSRRGLECDRLRRQRRAKRRKKSSASSPQSENRTADQAESSGEREVASKPNDDAECRCEDQPQRFQMEARSQAAAPRAGRGLVPGAGTLDPSLEAPRKQHPPDPADLPLPQQLARPGGSPPRSVKLIVISEDLSLIHI